MFSKWSVSDIRKKQSDLYNTPWHLCQQGWRMWMLEDSIVRRISWSQASPVIKDSPHCVSEGEEEADTLMMTEASVLFVKTLRLHCCCGQQTTQPLHSYIRVMWILITRLHGCSETQVSFCESSLQVGPLETVCPDTLTEIESVVNIVYYYNLFSIISFINCLHTNIHYITLCNKPCTTGL